MKAVAKGTTRKFIRVTDDKDALINELRKSIGKDFTGRIQGILRTEKGELEVVVEVLRGRIVAAGVEGYTNIDGGLALNTIINALLEGTGFLEIIELSEEGVNLDLEFNPRSRLSMPSSLELYISRIELRSRQIKEERKKQTINTSASEDVGSTFTSRYPPLTIHRRIEHLEPSRREVSTLKAMPPKPSAPTQPSPKEKQAVSREPIEKGEKSERRGPSGATPVRQAQGSKKIIEEIGLDEEVLEGIVINVREKPVVIEAIPSNNTQQPGTPTTMVERPVVAKPIVEEKIHEEPGTPVGAQHPVKMAPTPSPEELLSKLTLSDKIEDYSKSLLAETDRLLLSLIETREVLEHGREKIDHIINKAIELSKSREEPLKLSTTTAGKLYYIMVYKGSIVSAFKIDEVTENIELYGRAAIIDLIKKTLLGDIDYIISPIRDSYVLYTLGILKKEDVEREVEEKAEGLFSRLRKIFGGH